MRGVWLWNEPKEWRKLYKHTPRRSELAHKLAQIKKGYDPENMVWPLDRKPWIYYW